MNNDPFARPSTPEFLPDEATLAPRTSVMAIMSLVFSLTCCLSPLGLIFGGVSLVGISRSGGRVRGQGLAIAGIVIGLVGSLLLVGAVVGASQINKVFGTQFMGPMEQVVIDIESGNYAAARNAFDPSVQAALTDQAFADFSKEVSAAVGSYQSMPTGMLELIGSYFETGATIQQFQMKYPNMPNVIPIPATFDKGTVVLFIQISSQQSPGGMPPPINMAAVLPDGTEIWLIDPSGP